MYHTTETSPARFSTSPSRDLTFFYGTGLEELREKRDELQSRIVEEEAQRERVQNELRELTEELSKINNSLSKKVQLNHNLSLYSEGDTQKR